MFMLMFMLDIKIHPSVKFGTGFHRIRLVDQAHPHIRVRELLKLFLLIIEILST